ncbi:MAG: MlaD family protein [Phycisphaerales bacterium]
MQARSLRDNLLAGAFVIVGVAAAVWGSFLLGAKPPGAGLAFVVKFSLLDGAAGLKAGSPVTLGGQQIGQVRSVGFGTDDQGRLDRVNVTVEIDGAFPLYEDAWIFLERPLLGTLSTINIASAGSKEVKEFHGSPLIESGDEVKGMIAPPAFLAAAGFGPNESDAMKSIVGDVKATLKDVKAAVRANSPAVTRGIADGQRILAAVEDRIGKWRSEIDATLKGIRLTAEKAELASRKFPAITEDAEKLVLKGNNVAAEIEAVIAENRNSVKSTIDSLCSAAGKFDRDTMAEIELALGEMYASLGAFKIAVGNANEVLQNGRSDLRQTLANMSLASQEMKLLMSEVRAAPWRILHEPSLKERETEDIYGAANALAEAASSVRSASEALGVASTAVLKSEHHEEHMKQLTSRLDEAVEQYRMAGQKLMEELLKRQ